LVEAIVQLPVDLFYGAGIPACILVLNRAKGEDRKGRVLMIDNSTGFARRETKNVLTDDGIERAIATYNSGDEEEGWARWIAADELAGHHYNMVVRRYVAPGGDGNGEVLDLDEAISAYRDARAKRAAAEARLDDVLASLEES
jgi:type I restriction enzyme M protein